jgi:hypothetical protein
MTRRRRRKHAHAAVIGEDALAPEKRKAAEAGARRLDKASRGDIPKPARAAHPAIAQGATPA